MSDNVVLPEALRWCVDRGYRLFPLYPVDSIGECSCRKVGCKGKHPIPKDWPKVASVDPEVISNWTSTYPRCGWGVATGCESNVVVLDEDRHEGGEDGAASWANLVREHGDIVTTRTRTPHGRHHWFRYPKGRRKVANAVGLWPGVDMRADGGFIVVPPTPGYMLEEGVDPTDLPDWVVSRLAEGRVAKEGLPRKIGKGGRNTTLFNLAVKLFKQGLDDEEVLAAIQLANDRRGDPRLGDDEIVELVHSASNYREDDEVNTTDVANAQRLVRIHGDDMRHCKGLDTWLVWDGRRWRRDNTFEAFGLARDVADDIRLDMDAAVGREKQLKLARGWVNAQSTSGINNLMNAARTDLQVRVEDLDQGWGYINVRNGILDMGSKEDEAVLGKDAVLTPVSLTPHDPKRMLTRLMDVDYDPEATCPNWDVDFTRFFPNDEMRWHAQKGLGYALSGRGDAKFSLFFYGAPDTGKSTILQSILRMVGDYGLTSKIGLLCTRDKDAESATPFMAEWVNARLIIFDEIPKDVRINDGAFKSYTGGERLKGRLLYGTPFDARASHCFILAGNNRPHFNDTSGATTRRISIVGCDHPIPLVEQQEQEVVLARYRAEWSGILNWLVEGYRGFLREGLRVEPAAVTAARQAYETAEDVVANFIAERCDTGPGYEVKMPDLYRTYSDWCGVYGRHRMYVNVFTEEVARLGYKRTGRHNSWFMGLRLAAEEYGSGDLPAEGGTEVVVNLTGSGQKQ
jgi:putative DNA primase/helicase